MTAKLFAWAWAYLRYLPPGVARAVFTLVADACWALRLGDYDLFEANLLAARPGLDERGRRRLLRAAYRSMLRNYCDGFCLPGWSEFERLGRVRVADLRTADGTPTLEVVQEHLRKGRAVVAALAHSGSWDQAGAWAVERLGSVVTVAERLEPAAIFDSFVAFREGLGMHVVPLDASATVFKTLTRAARDGKFIPLLCDRDLTASGVEVDFLGRRARFAPGPAALAEAAGAVLVAIHIRYEKRLWTPRPPEPGVWAWLRRRLRTREWGIVISFSEPLDVPDQPAGGEADVRGRAARVRYRTQAAADFLGAHIRVWPEDWHMMQRVFTD
ncbi:phosphatidylinositol mannoside acyltransferase [Micrococcales bacterium 31B]|nr:phosphatidylinositol mannoside acyltransferase [Micrococcales bacterium 31B]